MINTGALAVHRRIGQLFGLAAVAGASLPYESAEQRDVLGRYSVVFALWLGLIATLLLLALVRSVRGRKRAPASLVRALVVEGACACLGAAYLASALSDRTYGARALDANLFGSPFVVAAVLEYAALCGFAAVAVSYAASRMRDRALNALMTIGVLVVLALLGEGLARAATFLNPRTLGIPSYSGRVFDRRYVQRNSHGFRDAEHDTARVPGTRRLVLVGDSYGFGVGVRQVSDRFGDQLASALTAASGEPWEVINCSMPDRATPDQFAFLRHGLAYQPDFVILLYVFNDADYLANTAGAATDAPRAGIFDQPRTMVGRLEPTRVMYKNSFAFQAAYVRWRLIRHRFSSASPGAAADVYHTPTLLRRHLDDLARFVAVGDSANAGVAIVPFDPGVVREGTFRERYRVFAEAAGMAGLPVWSIIDVYQGRTLREITVNALDAHANRLGYRLAVEAVAPRVLAAMAQRARGPQ